MFGPRRNPAIAALASLVLAGVSLGASTLHLGRPIYAWRALRRLRRSWLSREVLTLSLFAGAAARVRGDAVVRSAGTDSSPVLLTACAGIAGVTCSARIYIVRARPAWFSGYTIAEFFSTALLLGPLFVRTMLSRRVPAWLSGSPRCGGIGAACHADAEISVALASEVFELRASALLLSGRLRNLFVMRLAVLIVAGNRAAAARGRMRLIAALRCIALAGEWLGRYLFFVSVVPKNIAAAFTSGDRRAA